MVPNYVIVEILNILSHYHYFNSDISYRLVKKFRLVSKEWNEKILPKVSFKHITYKVENNKSLENLEKIMNFGIGFNLTIASQWISQKLVDMITSGKSNVVSIRTNIDAKHPNYIEQYKILTDNSLPVEIIDIARPSSMALTTTDLLFQQFLGVKHVELQSLNIDLDTLISHIDYIKPEILRLHSTPYGFSNKPLDPLYDYLATTNTTMKKFAVFNYFWSVTKKAIVNLLNNNRTITDLYVTNFSKDSEELEDLTKWEIYNNKLEKFSSEEFLPFWRSESRIQLINFANFAEEELRLVQHYFKNLQSLVLRNAKSQDFIIDVIKLNSSFKEFKLTTPEIKFNNDIIDSLKLNNKITSLYLGTISNEIVTRILRLNHPSITLLSFTPTSQETLSVIRDDILNNTTIHSYNFHGLTAYTKDNENVQTLELVITILEQKPYMVSFNYPFLHFNSTHLVPKSLELRLSALFNKHYHLLSFSVVPSSSTTLTDLCSPFIFLIK
ncbi:hypothetical protein DLAC_08904 [Tieghemostelium lacteum]|uniref:F-box domain-containing protein n=1 Tax=Tieghemostelium lacteum TaxID=361077 RepID=A0A151Z8M1_TIELA|nr:hypothetical protein DLAC_08904 [Tieghemostelium lacteum]|eukprot:KYQ90302.1 hypothetical protein DLAC_08904 [Tieghemostelium lacteum]